jgi:hypothetical protein
MSEIFDDKPVNDHIPPVDTPPPSAIQLPDSVKALVGEGKKYATVEQALAALPHSQEFIEQLKAENAQLREQAGRGVAQEEVYAMVQDYLKQQQPTVARVEEGDIAQVVDRALQQRELTQKVQQNEAEFKKAMQTKFGEKAKDVFLAGAQELGMAVKDLETLARTNPKAALKLLGAEGQSAAPRPTTPGSVNTGVLAAQRSADRDPALDKSIMFGAKTSDVIAKWRAVAPKSE